MIELEPSVEARVRGIPGHGVVVGVPHRDHSTGSAHAPHLRQGCDRVTQVLQHLVSVDDIEAVVGIAEVVDVADLEGDVDGAPVVRRSACLLEWSLYPVHADRLTGSDEISQVEGDRAGSTADVEQPLPRAQVRHQVGRRVLGRPPPV